MGHPRLRGPPAQTEAICKDLNEEMKRTGQAEFVG
jgi:hypothetical protein